MYASYGREELSEVGEREKKDCLASEKVQTHSGLCLDLYVSNSLSAGDIEHQADWVANKG